MSYRTSLSRFIIAKLPPSWRNFATSLKHLRREFSVEDVIGHLSVEQNSRAKDSHVKGAEGSSSANVVQKNFHKFKGKNSVQQNTTFKKKGKKKDKREMAALLVVQMNIGQTSAQTSTRSQHRTPSL